MSTFSRFVANHIEPAHPNSTGNLPALRVRGESKRTCAPSCAPPCSPLSPPSARSTRRALLPPSPPRPPELSAFGRTKSANPTSSSHHKTPAGKALILPPAQQLAMPTAREGVAVLRVEGETSTAAACVGC
ncbi:hypothetical protein DFH08DRAFT_975512 [Mycena albidolilacea]|uniref:Uncharacterized protein n=1 Tax=Mycena albidolilacea TaxID=1033008 RepID=A0AAD6Z4P0_9AGAR|nr:hypothetical protein DFH08DRAFT_975512 [Mycena albidolilacea]